MTDRIGKKGFTLVELLVVIAMLMLLAGAITTSVAGAHRRAKIQQATEQSLAFILGKESAQIKGQRGDIPVLFNAAVKKSGRILDPWGNPYYVTIRRDTLSQKENGGLRFNSYVVFPNYNRRPADELK